MLTSTAIAVILIVAFGVILMARAGRKFAKQSKEVDLKTIGRQIYNWGAPLDPGDAGTVGRVEKLLKKRAAEGKRNR